MRSVETSIEKGTADKKVERTAKQAQRIEERIENYDSTR